MSSVHTASARFRKPTARVSKRRAEHPSEDSTDTTTDTGFLGYVDTSPQELDAQKRAFTRLARSGRSAFHARFQDTHSPPALPRSLVGLPQNRIDGHSTEHPRILAAYQSLGRTF